MSKHYVVWAGHKPGVYDNWPECQKQVNGYKGALYKAFTDKALADAAYAAGVEGGSKAADTKVVVEARHGKPTPPYITADAAYSHATKILEWRVVLVKEGGVQEQVFRSKPYSGGSANIGEFLGVLDAFSYLSKHSLVMPVYSDSITAQAWIRDRTVNSTVKLFGDLNPLMKRYVEALQNGAFETIRKSCSLLDWKTRQWGEIPADFGRK